MHKKVHLILSLWIISYVGHAILSFVYEQSPAKFIVPAIYAGFVLLSLGVWWRSRWAAVVCMIAAVMTILIQGVFIWKREAYGSLSLPVLVFDIMGLAAGLLYLLFFFSSWRERYLEKPKIG